MLIGFMGPAPKTAAAIGLANISDVVVMPSMFQKITGSVHSKDTEKIRMLHALMLSEQMSQPRPANNHFVMTETLADVNACLLDDNYDDLETNFIILETVGRLAKRRMKEYDALFVFESDFSQKRSTKWFARILEMVDHWDLEVTIIPPVSAKDQAELAGLSCGIPLA